ncbi:zinc ribbon domain-containing protein [Maritimibacter sp. HL-12]|uniref:zinc ribbon domain-containing protein n=1 Tax=Maritimibacter sp. HL-12 TaxID=1162418 RepID=UPI000A0EFDC4|nr:zinc ribbon domain-containing protein [Maritimibacter sp. HL-12]SMH30840.1 NTP pyrophosphohydrolases containing a Zn-finger, probably nucleic-acid-binding [Maritimibacter sp. HL-12]
MKLVKGDLIATGAELVAAPAVLGLNVGPLARLPQVRPAAAAEQSVAACLAGLRAPVAADIRALLATLANPLRIGTLHYALGEESLTRAILAWGPDSGAKAVLMVSRAEDWAIRAVSATDLADTIASVLLEDLPLAPARLQKALSPDAALVFLAALHALRAGRLKALLAHDFAPVAFTPGAIAEALEDVGAEDFRWPLLFLDKVLPFSLDGLNWEARIGPALGSLADRGLVERVKKSKTTWMLTPLGYQLAVADAQHLTKVGLRVTATTDEDLKGHEAFLFLRSVQDVMLYDLGGREAVIASIPFADLRSLLATVLTPPAKAVAGGAEKMPDPQICPTCGHVLEPAAKFCPACGAKVAAARGGARSCASCGAPLVKGAKFCADCGAKA